MCHYRAHIEITKIEPGYRQIRGVSFSAALRPSVPPVMRHLTSWGLHHDTSSYRRQQPLSPMFQNGPYYFYPACKWDSVEQLSFSWGRDIGFHMFSFQSLATSVAIKPSLCVFVRDIVSHLRPVIFLIRLWRDGHSLLSWLWKCVSSWFVLFVDQRRPHELVSMLIPLA